MSEEIYLYPEELTIDPAYNTRLWPLSPIDQAAESALVTRLASSIESMGQFDAAVCVVDLSRPLPHVLVTGQRRRRAIAQINSTRRDQPGDKPLMKLRVRIDNTNRDMFQYAALSNVHNQSMSPMEIASLILHLRRKSKYSTIAEGNVAIGKYLEMEEAAVRDYTHLLQHSDPATRAALHAGTINKPAAVELLRSMESKRTAVLKLAADIEAGRSFTTDQYVNSKSPLQNDLDIVVRRITRGSVVKAVEQLGVGERTRSRNRAEINQLIGSLDVPERGCVDGHVRVWARAMLNWMKGRETAESMWEKFDAMTKTAYRGRHSAADDYEAECLRKRKRKLDKVVKKKPVYSRSKLYKEVDDSTISI